LRIRVQMSFGGSGICDRPIIKFGTRFLAAARQFAYRILSIRQEIVIVPEIAPFPYRSGVIFHHLAGDMRNVATNPVKWKKTNQCKS
jgi:hypothetical protein